jgi:NADH dehydrogenase/putative oxidoreductase
MNDSDRALTAAILAHTFNRLRDYAGSLLAGCQAVMRVAAPVIDLVVRVSLAKAFFDPGMLPACPFLDVLRTAWAAIFVEVFGPVLMAAGFMVRPIALLMLLLTLLAQVQGAPREEHLFWAALFGWYVVQGAGPLSLDHLLAKGLGLSPLPFARRATTAARWSERQLVPLYRLALRVWLAAAILGTTLMPAMSPAMHAIALPRPVATIAAACLALGLATPMVAGALLAAGAVMVFAGSDAAATLYGPSLLALIAAFGAGRYSVDHLIGWLLRRDAALAPDTPHVVIVGAGFDGTACAAALRHERVRVTLIDRNNYHLFQPLLYQVATASLSPGDVATPIRRAFRSHPRLHVLCGTVSGVDADNRTVSLDGRPIHYDFLVLATGATHGYFGHETWASHAPGLKSIGDAIAVRSRILNAFEQAEAAEDPARREALLTFLICGAGPTGVELAGAIAELAHNGMARDFRNFEPASARIVLVQSGPRVLPQFDARLSGFAQRSLEALGVEVHVNSTVEDIDAGGAIVNGVRIAAGTVLWAAGVTALPAATWLGIPADHAGRIAVGPDLTVGGRRDVFAIGDTALSLGSGGAPVPGLAPAAKQGGRYAASVISARLRGRAPPPPFRYRHQGSLATIGRKSAIADFGRLKLTGAVAWWLWGAVHILFLAGLRNRASVVFGWVWSYFTFDVGVRLITQDQPRVSAE